MQACVSDDFCLFQDHFDLLDDDQDNSLETSSTEAQLPIAASLNRTSDRAETDAENPQLGNVSIECSITGYFPDKS